MIFCNVIAKAKPEAIQKLVFSFQLDCFANARNDDVQN
jgi:hypothetical protein